MNTKNIAMILGLAGASGVGCTPTSFESRKATLLKSASVFSVSNSERYAGTEEDAQGEVAQDRAGEVEVPIDENSHKTHKLRFYCSNSRGGNEKLATTSNVRIEVMDTNRVKVCEFTSHSLRGEILANHGVPHRSLQVGCGNALPAKGEVFMFGNGGGEIGSFRYNVAQESINIADVLLNGIDIIQPGDLWADYNPEHLPAGVTMTIPISECDTIASPLVVRLGPQDSSVQLTSQARGILFDILGIFADPVPHTPKRISWFTGGDQHALIALPNALGEVRGIDELFGDNTAGPDGRGAPNGYLALAKHDANLDGFITPEDPVFEKLRLWTDRDRDGRSSPRELRTLREESIEAIDLNYDPRYLERDKYGNETRMKSAVRLSNGELRLMFDIWFAYRER